MDPVALITAEIADLATTIGGVAAAALGLAASVFGIRFGWRFAKGLAGK